MSTFSSFLVFPRRKCLPTCLAASLGFALGLPHSSHAANPPPTPHAVTTCDDDVNNPDPTSLRGQVAAATSGDTIDLSLLSMTCSVITLASEIEVQQNSLYFEGPGAAELRIDGNDGSRIFKHTGAGTLGVHALTIVNGHYIGNGMSVNDGSHGGCIYSSGNLNLVESIVSYCKTEDIGLGIARGGGIFSAGNVNLFKSEVSRSEAHSAEKKALGGGVYATGAFSAKYSTISDNIADAPSVTSDSVAGGIFVLQGPVTIEASTISGNRAEKAAGLSILSNVAQLGDEIVNSTISGNESSLLTAGVWTTSGLAIYNSTIAFNHVTTTYSSGAGLYSQGPLHLESSIVADNFTQDGPHDVAGVGQAMTGVRNLVYTSGPPLPPDTLEGVCPRLQPLANNGGSTRTHALRHSTIPSPAIDVGNNALNLSTDQRFLPRVDGVLPDIGAVESQASEIDEDILFAGFDGLCDQ